MKKKKKVQDTFAEQMPLRVGHLYISQGGVRWSFGWFKTQIGLGKIPSQKIFSSRIVLKSDLDAIIKDHKEKTAE